MSDNAPDRDDARPETDDEPAERKTKKERVLHTRVPAILEQELKNLAASWRMPVSNVVRAILEDAIDTVDRVGRAAEGELIGVAQRLADERARLRHAPQETLDAPGEPKVDAAVNSSANDRSAVNSSANDRSAVNSSANDRSAVNSSAITGAVGFTAMVLANDVVCPVTGEALRAGEQAFLVHFLEPGRHAIVSPRAVPAP